MVHLSSQAQDFPCWPRGLRRSQEERRFPERVEYLTSVAGQRGSREQHESRWDYGLERGGELVMISDLCIMRNNPETGILELDTVFPGISVDDVVNNTGWSLDAS